MTTAASIESRLGMERAVHADMCGLTSGEERETGEHEALFAVRSVASAAVDSVFIPADAPDRCRTDGEAMVGGCATHGGTQLWGGQCR